jgi:hypothetical protein
MRKKDLFTNFDPSRDFTFKKNFIWIPLGKEAVAIPPSFLYSQILCCTYIYRVGGGGRGLAIPGAAAVVYSTYCIKIYIKSLGIVTAAYSYVDYCTIGILY